MDMECPEQRSNVQGVAPPLKQVLEVLAQVYTGYSQYAALKTILIAMLTGEPVLLVGSHGTYKSSMANFVGKVIDKPVVYIEEDAKNFADIESFAVRLGKELRVEPEALMQNRVDGVDVVYTDYPGKVRIRAEVDLIKHNINGDVKRVPLRVFAKQVNDQMDPEDLLGYAVHHPAVLGNKPPHVVKTGRLAGADYIILDEIFKAPRFLSKLHTVMNEKIVETAIGPVNIAPLCFVFCTNPLTSFYQSNVKITDVATTDRFLLSTQVDPPSSVQVLNLASSFGNLVVEKRLRLEAILEARKQVSRVKVPHGLTAFCAGLVAALSTCYFSTAQSSRAKLPQNPFTIEKDCSICVYKGSPCSIANIGKVRSLTGLMKVMRASAALRGADAAVAEDLDFAVRTVLPHRLHYNDVDFLTAAGTPYSATVRLVNIYADQMDSYAAHLDTFVSITTGRKDWAGNPSWDDLENFITQVQDAPPLRALADDLVMQMKEAAEKTGGKVPDAFHECVTGKAATIFTKTAQKAT